MKKILLPVLALFAAGAYGQTYFSDDFTAGIGSWSIYDTDGDGEEWNISNAAAYSSAVPFDGDFAQSRSWTGASGALNPDNYMVTTAGIVVPGGISNCILQWTTGTIQSAPFHEEQYSVYIATGSDLGSATSGTLVFNETLPDDQVVLNRSVDLSAYAGSTIYLVFRHHDCTDMNMLVIDDVNVVTLPDYDMTVTDVNLDQVVAPGAVTFDITVKNEGALPATSFDVTWDDGSGVQTHAYTGAPIASGGSAVVTHSTDLTAVAGTSYSIDFCVDIASDGDASNDCMSADTYAASGEAPRLTCVEVFTSSTCPPCFSLNYSGYDGSGLNAGLDAENANDQDAAGLSAIKYQVNWPGSGDHAYNGDVATRVSYYGITGAPTPGADGAMSGWTGFNSGFVTPYKNTPSFVEIEAEHTISGGTVDVDVTLNPYANFPGVTLRVAILDKQYDAGSGGSFSNGETEFHHVMRKMLPNASGTAVTLTDGTPYTNNFTYSYTEVTAGTFPAQGTYDFHNGAEREVVIFVQDDATGQILNSAISKDMSEGGGDIGFEEASQNFDINVYPNPTNDFATVGITLGENADVTFEVYNIVGELVYQSNTENLSAGDYLHQIDVNEFTAGVYTVKTTVNQTISTTKLSVQ